MAVEEADDLTMIIEPKLHVVALRSYEELSYEAILNKLRAIDPTLKALRIHPNTIAFEFKQLLKHHDFKKSLSIIKKKYPKIHIKSYLYCQAYTAQISAEKYKGYITIYTQPIFSYIAATRVILRYPSKECLYEINKQFLSIFVSKAEFTIDLICDKSRELYLDIMRHLYIPYRRKSSLKNIGMHETMINTSLTTNHAFQISHLKLYERGEDKKRVKLPTGRYGWNKEDINKIRLEYNINNKILQKWGARTTIVQRGKRLFKMTTLEDFLECNIDPLSEYNIMFKQSKKHDIFLLCYISMQSKQKKKLKEHKKLEQLKDKIFSVVRDFVNNWSNYKNKQFLEDNFDLEIEDDISIFNRVPKLSPNLIIDIGKKWFNDEFNLYYKRDSLLDTRHFSSKPHLYRRE